MILGMLLALALAFAINSKVEAAYTNGTRKVKIQAHRGYSGRYPENTLLAYEKAIEAGADHIELDVHLSKDGVVFVMHDGDVSRTTNGEGNIRNLTATQMKALDAGSWFDTVFAGTQVPTIGEALDCMRGRALVNIELKVKDETPEWWQQTVVATAEAIESRHMWNEIIFSSFSLTAIKWARERYPQAFVGLLDWKLDSTEDRQPQVVDIGGKGWFAHWRMATPERVALAHERGLMVISAAGNDEPTRAESVLAHVSAGVDVISSNYTREVIDVLVANGFRKV